MIETLHSAGGRLKRAEAEPQATAHRTARPAVRDVAEEPVSEPIEQDGCTARLLALREAHQAAVRHAPQLRGVALMSRPRWAGHPDEQRRVGRAASAGPRRPGRRPVHRASDLGRRLRADLPEGARVASRTRAARQDGVREACTGSSRRSGETHVGPARAACRGGSAGTCARGCHARHPAHGRRDPRPHRRLLVSRQLALGRVSFLE